MRITKRTARNSGVACGVAAAATALAMSTATSGWGVSTALVIGGIGTPTLSDTVMSQLLGGALGDYDQRVAVNWPAEARPYTGETDMTLGDSIEIGTANLDAQIDEALAALERDENGELLEGEQVTVVGLSAGSLVVTETLREMTTDDDEDPDANEINFVVVADSSRQQILNDSERYNAEYDYTYRPPPQTVYDTVEITAEYDGYADFPDRWWNFNALLNAEAGKALVHIPAMFSDISEVPKQNTTVTTNALGGTTVNYLVPAERLPLVQVNPSLAPREAELRAAIDKAYIRNDPANVAARLAGPDVPERIRDIITPDDEVDGVNLAATAAAQQDAEESASAEATDGAPVSLSDQLSAAVTSADDDEAGVTDSTGSTASVGSTDSAGSTETSVSPSATSGEESGEAQKTRGASDAETSDASESSTASDTAAPSDSAESSE